MAIITTTNLSALEFGNRIDGELYNPNLLLSLCELKQTGYELKPIGSFCVVKSGTTPTDRDDSLKDGPILFKTTDIRNNVLSPYNDYYHINTVIHNRMQKTKLKGNDVLLNIVGATLDVIGRSAIIKDDIKEANITQAMAFLRIIKDNFKSGFLFAYLNTKYAQDQIKRYARPTGQFNLNLVEVKKILVPNIVKDLQTEIDELVNQSGLLQSKSHTLYQQAEELLAQELQLDKLQLPKNKWYTAQYSEVVNDRRMDGEYYQPEYTAIATFIYSYKYGCCKVSDAFYENKDVSSFNQDEYKYIEIGDVNITDGTYGFNEIPQRELPVSAKIKLKKGDVLISTVRPYRGAVTIITDDYSDLIGSSAFTIVREKNSYKKETLLLLLRMDCYKELLMKYNAGTSYPVIKNTDVMNMVIPLIPDTLQIQLSALIQQSFEAKQKSKQLLARAKSRVEELIEQEANKK